MANIKSYKIEINGIQESINAVDALNKELSTLEQRIKALEGKAVKVGASGGGSKSSSTSSLSEEEKLQKQINQLEEKRIAHSKQIYQNYLAAKDVLKETENDQKQIAATERLQAKNYSNTMAGMKQELADIKAVMQTVDLGDGDQMTKMVTRANELNSKLKEIEQSYGQFGRNVGNYSSAFDGMQKLSITVGGVTREFNSAREASKTLKNELIGLEAAGSGNTEVAKELRSEYYKLQSAMDDATKSSKAMDEAMDLMQSFTAMASVGQGLKGFFGFDESEIQRSIQKLVSLQNVLKGIETIKKQIETGEGFGKIFGEGGKAVDGFISKVTGAKLTMDGLTMSSRAATFAVRGLSMALKGAGIGLIISAISLAVDGIEKFVKSLDTTKVKENALEKESKALNRQYEIRKDLLAGSYMSNIINSEEFLKEQYKIENDYLEQQINLLQKRASLINNKSWLQNISEFFSSGEENGFTGKRIGGNASSSSWNFTSSFSYDVKNLEEAEQAWKKLNKAVSDGNDYWSEYGKGLKDWFSSLFTTVKQTEDVMKGIGNIALSDTIGEFEELNQKFKNGKISADEFAKGLKELTDKMNSSEVINSVIANLDEYIPDEEVRKKVQNILTYIGRLNDEFNAVSEAQIHHWNQVRIDAMAEGAAKIAAQMAEDERHEIAQYGKTQEQITLIQKKYQRKRLDETKKHNKKVSSENKRHQKEQLEAEKDLSNLRIANMKEGLNKVLKQLEEERKQRLKKVEADGILVAERQAEIDKLYNKKTIDAKREWAEKVQQVYKSMWDNIFSYSLETTSKLADLASQSSEIGRENYNFARNTKGAPYRINAENSSYGVQGKNQLSLGTQIELQFEEQNNKKLRDTYNERAEIIKKYWSDRINFEISAITANYNAQVLLENENYEKLKRDNASHSEDLNREAEKKLRESAITQEQYDEILERNLVEHQNRESVLYEQHNNNLKKLEQEKAKSIQNINAESYRERIQELRDFQTAIANLESKQPVFNSWGIINLSETKKNNENLLTSYRTLANEIVTLKRKLQDQLDKNEISFDDFQQANRELDSFAENVGQKMDKVKYELSIGAQIGSFIQSINQYVQAGLQAVQTIMNSLNEYQDYQFEKEQEMLEKENELLQNKLDKQEDIIEEHKSKIDSIEDELATSRGDRRQHLIDQLNAEVEAQRAAQKEEQRIQKQKEANERKQEALEKKRRKAEYERNLMSIIVAGAMAAANGFATEPFIPVGLAMGALATTLTAAQYAIAAAQKPYATGGQLDGGVAVGNRHRDGGIKVLGGRAEIEGGEFITNRFTTAKNLDLLEYVNSKKKKIDISDMLEFYNGGKVKTSIQRVRTKFEDGGYMPTLPDALDIRDQLQNIIVNQDNRPIYVSVVDINNKQDDVRRVQTLAGIE